MGDKARNKVFDNSKIERVVPQFKNMKPFNIGIKETINYYNNHETERIVDYIWDGKIDRAIIKLSKSNKISVDKKMLHFASAEKNTTLKEEIYYLVGRYWFLNKSYNFVNKIKRKILKAIIKHK